MELTEKFSNYLNFIDDFTQFAKEIAQNIR